MDNLDAHRSHLAEAIPRVAALADLIREGIVVPIPHLKLTLQRQEKIWTGVRHLLSDDDYVALINNPVDRPALTQDDGSGVMVLTRPRTAADGRIQQYGDAAYYLSRSIAMADASYASYLPPSATEWAIYQQRLTRLGAVLARDHKLDLTVAPALVQSSLPYFKGLSGTSIVGARRDDENFAHWRASLRTAVRQISSPPSDGDAFVSEARSVLHDHLAEPAAEVRRATSRSGAFKRNLRSTGLTLSTGAAGIGGAAAVGGGPATFGPLTITGMLRWVGESLFTPSASGSKAVLAHLVHDPHVDNVADDWPQRGQLILLRKR